MKKYVIPICLLLLLLTILSIPLVPVLSISARKTPTIRYYVNSKNLTQFVISYTHSVNKGRVHDYYNPTKQKEALVLEKTVFVSYGAGIPEPEETPGAIFTKTSEGYEISNLQRVVQKLTMAVGLIANHEITFITDKNMINYKLTDLFEPQTSIIIQKKVVSLLEYWQNSSLRGAKRRNNLASN